MDYKKQRESIGFAFHFNEEPTKNDSFLPSLLDRRVNKSEMKRFPGGLFHNSFKDTRSSVYTNAVNDMKME